MRDLIRRKSSIALFITVAFLAISLPVFVYYTTQTQTLDRRAATSIDAMTGMNNQIVSLSEQYRTATTSQKTSIRTNLISIATLRKKQLLNEIKTNPALFLSHALPKSERSKLAPELISLGLIEEEITINGTLQVVITDDFNNKKSWTEYKVKTKNPSGRQKNNYTLYTARGEITALSDSVVQVSGVSLDNNLVISDATSSQFQVTTASTTVTIGSQKIAVFLVNFANNPVEPVGKQQQYDLLFTGGQSIQKFYHEYSYGKLNFVGDVFGYYTLSFDKQLCEYYNWAIEVERLASNQGIDVSRYPKRVFVILPDSISTDSVGRCTSYFGGWADVGGNPARAWINGAARSRISTYIHELGHTLGLQHSSDMECGTFAVHYGYFNKPSYCRYEEYGDWWDSMGGSLTHHFNAAHKSWLQWFSTSQIQTIAKNNNSATNSFYVILTPYETTSVGLKAVKIPVSNQLIPYTYYIEYRRPIGFDTYLPGILGEGIFIHLQKNQKDLAYYFSNRTYLIDTTPNSSTALDLADVSLLDGKTFYDSYNKIIIKQIRHDANSATVYIDLGPGTNLTPISTPPYSNF